MKDYTKLSPDEKDALVKKAMDVGFQTETDYGNCIKAVSTVSTKPSRIWELPRIC